VLDNLVLLCRRHHVLWHLGKLGLDGLAVPWLTSRVGPAPPTPEQSAAEVVDLFRS
jgi:hypothetical protein